jgi:cytoskeletal protein RodZ
MKRVFPSIVIAVLLVNSGIAGILLWREMHEPAPAPVVQPQRVQAQSKQAVAVKHRPKRSATRPAKRQAKRSGRWDTTTATATATATETATEAEIAAAREREQWTFTPRGKCGSPHADAEVEPARSEVCCHLNCLEAYTSKRRQERCGMKCMRYHDHKMWQWVQDTAEKT